MSFRTLDTTKEFLQCKKKKKIQKKETSNNINVKTTCSCGNKCLHGLLLLQKRLPALKKQEKRQNKVYRFVLPRLTS